jgi:hypothetical protein
LLGKAKGKGVTQTQTPPREGAKKTRNTSQNFPGWLFGRGVLKARITSLTQ